MILGFMRHDREQCKKKRLSNRFFKDRQESICVLFFEVLSLPIVDLLIKKGNLVKQVRDVNLIDGIATNDKGRLHQPVDVASSVMGEARGNGELKAVEEKGSTPVTNDASTGGKQVTLSEKRVVPNGVANAC